MMQLLPYAYAFIDKATGLCFQVSNSPNPSYHLDNDHAFSLPVQPGVHTQYLDKYYHDGTWWERIDDTEAAWMPKY